MRRLIVVALVLISLAGGTALAQQFSTLEERMTYAEFQAAGLEKLTPEELAALNSWLAGKSSIAATPSVDTRGFDSRTNEDGAVVSSVKGPFNGWKGKGDRIMLTNGQIWEITDSSSRLSVSLQDPTVIVEPGILNSWYLKVDGYNTRARVKRIK
jgi:hypothetical protein